jgi:hypothetical protein
MASIADGNAASELVVANAIEHGSATAATKRRIGTRAMSATGKSTPPAKTISA